MKLTKEQVAGYLADPTKCPCCGKDQNPQPNDEMYVPDYDPSIEMKDRLSMHRDVECDGCEVEFTLVFTLTNIKLEDK